MLILLLRLSLFLHLINYINKKHGRKVEHALLGHVTGGVQADLLWKSGSRPLLSLHTRLFCGFVQRVDPGNIPVGGHDNDAQGCRTDKTMVRLK